MKRDEAEVDYNLPKTTLALIPEHILEEFISKQDRILNLLEAKHEEPLNGYVTEKQAIQTVHKKTTWFWQMRKSGRLPFKKIGQTNYYSLSDINSLLKNE